MRTIFLTLVLLFFGSAMADWSSAQPAKGKISPARLQGMKEALVDIEKGMLMQRLEYPVVPPAFLVAWSDLAKKEYGIDMSITFGRPEDDGYNAVMLLEIEHRFGRGVMTKIAERAEAEYLKNKKK
jgi:hypothetical protein